VTASVALVLSLGGGVAFGAYVWTARSIPTIPGEQPGPDSPTLGEDQPPAIEGHCDERSCNYLLLGSDDRTGLSNQQLEDFGTTQDIGGEQRSDTIILVHTQPDQRAVILSFPRDLWVDIPGQGHGKINSAFDGGIGGRGAYLVARTVTQLTGMRVNHVMYVNLAGFEGVVNAIGGVDMCFPERLVSPLAGLDLPAGCSHLTAQQALGVVRMRDESGQCDNPDFWRIGRQQQFFRAVLAKLLSPAEITKLPGVVRAGAKNVVVDDGLNPTDLAYLAGQLHGIETGEADFRAVPGDWSNHIGAVAMDPSARDLFRAIRDGGALGTTGEQLQGAGISPANVTTAVYDTGSGTGAPEALRVLSEGGFDVDPALRAASTLESSAEGSAIVYERGAKPEADVVGGYLSGMKRIEVPRGSLGSLDVAVVVTAPYHLQAVGSGTESSVGRTC
jgi:LCP family protein required for cell wall assembly